MWARGYGQPKHLFYKREVRRSRHWPNGLPPPRGPAFVDMVDMAMEREAETVAKRQQATAARRPRGSGLERQASLHLPNHQIGPLLVGTSFATYNGRLKGVIPLGVGIFRKLMDKINFIAG